MLVPGLDDLLIVLVHGHAYLPAGLCPLSIGRHAGAESDSVTFWSVVPSFSGETLPAAWRGNVTRIYSHTIQDAPEASRPLLEGLVAFSPTGKLLNLHAQMAHSPAVLAVVTGYFLNYAQTPMDLPAAPGGRG